MLLDLGESGRSGELHNGSYHEAEGAKDSKVHDESARDAAAGAPHRVADREEKPAQEDEGLQD